MFPWRSSTSAAVQSRARCWMRTGRPIISSWPIDVGSEDEIRSLIEQGQARAGIIIPPDYNIQLGPGERPGGIHPGWFGCHRRVLGLFGRHPDRAIPGHPADDPEAGAQRPECRHDPAAAPGAHQVWYNPDLVSSYFMIPGVIGMILYAITSILTATAVVRERERGTIEQLIVTPIRPWELVIGKILPYVILAFIDTLEVLAIGHWWFGMPVRGDLGLILACSGLLLLSGSGDRAVRLHHRQHPAGGHADRLDDDPADPFSFRVSSSRSRPCR